MGKFLISCGVLVVVAFFAGYIGLRSYLQSEGFRRFLSAEAGGAAKVKGEFKDLRWDGLAVKTDGFQGAGKGPISSISVERIETEIGYGGFSRGVWEVKPTRIGAVVLNITKKKGSGPVSDINEVKLEKVEKAQPGWVPREVELDSLEIEDVSIFAETEDGVSSAEGMRVFVEPAGGGDSYRAEIEGGIVKFPNDLVPQLEIDRIEGTYRRKRLFLTEAKLSGWENGRISSSGEFDFESGTAAVEGAVDGVSCDEFLDENWARRLTGDASTSYVFDNRSGKQVISGELKIDNGRLTALPLLDALAAYADTRRFREMQLSEAHTKWNYTDDETLLYDLVLASEGLFRLEGRFSIKGEDIDGQFQLGLVPGVLSNIPGAETAVFKPGSHGLLWTPVRISGTLDDVEEDLTVRLIDAAGMRMLEKLPESGELVLKFTQDVIDKNSHKVVEEGVKVLEKTDKVLREASGFLDGILGK
ncbi:hypothetical protein [Luteolibacter sp. AS25]|uniref:hypothetical protein n=1 Tax=Luteolibacter sp. AS25 TaxID=3135776 RepID=UPI00398B8F19